MAIHRSGKHPIKIHKALIIRLLRDDPSCFRQVCASTDEHPTAEAFIAALEWFVNGTLSDGKEVR